MPLQFIRQANSLQLITVVSIVVALAYRAAKYFTFGLDLMSNRPGKDIEMATHFAVAMVMRLGFAPSNRPDNMKCMFATHGLPTSLKSLVGTE
ncbi:hypothetical protein L195_g048263, partial [Trifolium pratense]